MKRTAACLLALLLFAAAFCARAELEVHFLDVGEGDAALVLCDGEAMLIDGGGPSRSGFIYAYIKEHTERLRVVVATHPHEDHVGGLPGALNAVPVDAVWSPVTEWDGSSFRALLRYAELQGAPVVVPDEGDRLSLGGAVVTVLHCWPDAWDVNDMSIVLRVDYGAVSFLFTGDAEAMSEYMMIDAGVPLRADVLKVGHHGSRSSTTAEFVGAVRPSRAVISCGAGNRYGHPHPEVLEALAGVPVLRTDGLGTIVFRSDGVGLSFDSDAAREGALPEGGDSGEEAVPAA